MHGTSSSRRRLSSVCTGGVLYVEQSFLLSDLVGLELFFRVNSSFEPSNGSACHGLLSGQGRSLCISLGNPQANELLMTRVIIDALYFQRCLLLRLFHNNNNPIIIGHLKNVYTLLAGYANVDFVSRGTTKGGEA